MRISRKGRIKSVTSSHNKEDKLIVGTLARGLEVLRVFQIGDHFLSNAEIAKRTSLPKPTVSRLTHTLSSLGYLRYSEQHGQYQLGETVLALGYNVLANMEIRDLARPDMQKLATSSQGSVCLGILEQLEIMYIETCRGEFTVSLPQRFGTKVPICTTAIGRAYIGAMPDEGRNHLYAQLKTFYGDQWSDIHQNLQRALEESQERGYSLSLGEWNEHVNAVAVSIKGSHSPSYVLNVGGLSTIITREKLENELVYELQKIADTLSMTCLIQ